MAVSDLLEAQHRLIYSLLKPVARVAARFEVSIGVLSELFRIAYFEVLHRELGLSNAEIAVRFGQSERHMRNLGQRLRSDFFTAEREVGLSREIEAVVAAESPTRSQVLERFSTWSEEEIMARVDQLISEGRIELDDSGNLQTAKRYVVMRSDEFKHRIDALNHFLVSVHNSIIHRLVFDNRRTARIKTMTFAAAAERLEEYFARLEGDLRRDLAELEEDASFRGMADQQYTLSLTLAPLGEPAAHNKDEDK